MINLKNMKIAHRGLYNNVDIPENSIKAFKKALLKNLPIELDVHLLKDNTLVVFHDNNLKRMTGIDKEIKDLTYDELSKITLLKTDEHIPTLLEVLKLVDGKVLLNIEVKYDENYQKTCEELVRILDNYKGEFLIQSFSFKIILWFKLHRKNYIRGLLVSNKDKYMTLATNFLVYNLLKPNYYALNKKTLNNDKIKKLRAKNIPILFWTVKGKDEIDKYSHDGDGIIYEEDV